tara:strand:+ start:184 stop:417 length:234 start_codon:yes stop_codon:yes gene_type:complete
MKKSNLTATAIAVLMTLGSIANADLLYNPMEDSWEFGNYNDSYMYNALENEWSYEPSGSQLQYNTMENSWDYFYEGY